MPQDPQFDVFLSHSSKDKAVVRELAERLRSDGLRVWFDESGGNSPANIEDGLENSRVLVFCMSANAFGSEWAQLESQTFRFRDPLNKDRRFIPLRLDNAPIKDSLDQFLYIDWAPNVREREYPRLLAACRSVTEQGGLTEARVQFTSYQIPLSYQGFLWHVAWSPDGDKVLSSSDASKFGLWEIPSGNRLRIFEGHSEGILSTVWSPNGKYILSCSVDTTMRLWETASGRCLRVFKGHTDSVYSAAWSPDMKHVLSGSSDGTLRLWKIADGKSLTVFEGHTEGVSIVVWSIVGEQVLSGSFDGTMRLWDIKSGHCLGIYAGHNNEVWSVEWSPNGQQALSASSDHTVRLWDIPSGNCIRVLEGHTDRVNSVAWSPDGQQAVSGSHDKTARVWETATGRCLWVLKADDIVWSVNWSADGSYVLSGSANRKIRIWYLSFPQPPIKEETEQVQYTNAKVLLVGDSGVGKTGLSNYLAHGIKVEDDKPIPSTDGAWATHWPLRHAQSKPDVDREIWLWDFAGQVDYRLVHQLFMDDTAAAALVFNPQNENPFESLGHWDNDLAKARESLTKLLVAGRIDRGGLVVSDASVQKFMNERGFLQPLHLTSAKTGEGCESLRQAIVEAIDWQSIPETTSPALYHRMKQEIIDLRDKGRVLMRLAELKQHMDLTLREDSFKPEELNSVVSLLSGPGMIQRLDFGGFILLRPGVLSRYAAAVVRKVRKHPQELGCIREDDFLAGRLRLPGF